MDTNVRGRVYECVRQAGWEQTRKALRTWGEEEKGFACEAGSALNPSQRCHVTAPISAPWLPSITLSAPGLV